MITVISICVSVSAFVFLCKHTHVRQVMTLLDMTKTMLNVYLQWKAKEKIFFLLRHLLSVTHSIFARCIMWCNRINKLVAFMREFHIKYKIPGLKIFYFWNTFCLAMRSRYFSTTWKIVGQTKSLTVLKLKTSLKVTEAEYIVWILKAFPLMSYFRRTKWLRIMNLIIS